MENKKKYIISSIIATLLTFIFSIIVIILLALKYNDVTIYLYLTVFFNISSLVTSFIGLKKFLSSKSDKKVVEFSIFANFLLLITLLFLLNKMDIYILLFNFIFTMLLFCSIIFLLLMLKHTNNKKS